MEKLDDHTPQDWIASRTRPMSSANRSAGVTVAHCVPAGFEAYAKIFHPIYVNEGGSSGATWQDMRPRRSLVSRLKSLVGRGDPIEELMADATVVGVGAGDDERANRITWREAAEAQGLVYHADINVESFMRGGESWPVAYYYPDEGNLGDEFTAQLVAVLARHTDSQPCYFSYDVITGHDEEFQGDTLYRGELVELPGWLRSEEHWTPTLWWPHDQSWCVQCDCDLTFTLVGGSRALIDAILADEVVEGVEVTEESRVDNLADTINVPGAMEERQRKPAAPISPDPDDPSATVTVDAAVEAFNAAGFAVEVAETAPDHTWVSNADSADGDESVVMCTIYRSSTAAKREADRDDQRIGNAVCSLMVIDAPEERQAHWRAQYERALRSLRAS